MPFDLSRAQLGPSLFAPFSVTEGVDYARGSFHQLCLEGNFQKISKFLAKKEKIDIDELDLTSTRTPLSYACLSGSLNVASRLIERGASVDLPKGKGKQQITPVAFFAAAGGHQVLFQLLLKRGAVLDRVFGSLSVLHVAIHHNKLGFADSALQKGLSPDIGSEVLSPLHLSCMEGNLEAVRLLIDYGGKVVPQFGAPSALHFAATYGAIGVIDTLLSAGCPLDSMATAGTPLCCACRARQLQIAKILIQKGASVQINSEKSFGTPLHVAASVGSEEITHLLLSNEGEADAVTSSNKTPLHCAAEGGHLRVVKLLLRVGLRVNSVTKLGRSPLHEAVEKGHFEVVRYLVNTAGADVLLKDHNGKTARQLAQNAKEIGKFLHAIEIIRAAENGATSISLGNLGLEIFPSQLLSLSNLQTIDLRNNKIQIIPHGITSLSHLTTLKLAGNPLQLIPKRAIDEKGKALLSFLKNLEQVDQCWARVKLMIVGKEAVGKTSLFRAMSGSEKAVKLDQKGDTVSTEGIDILDLRIGDMNFSTWDFGGQEVFYPTHTFFLSKKAIYSILFNILDEDLSRIEYWIRLIKASTDQAPPLLLVATHADMICQETLEQKLSVVKQRFRNYRNVQGVLAISSRTKYGIAEFSEKLVRVAKESGTVSRKVPRSYFLLERQISLLKEKRPTLSWNEFLEITRDCAITSEAEAKKVCRFFHDVGVLLHFDDSRSDLSDLVILNAQWLADVMAGLVSFRLENNIRDGVLSFSKLCGIWEEFSNEMRLKLLLLLERFQIAYRMRPMNAYNPDMGALVAGDFGGRNPMTLGKKEKEEQKAPNLSYDIVIPSLLPDSPPNKKELASYWPDLKNGMDEYRRVYQFDFLPLGLFGRIIVRMLHIADVTCTVKWREGIVLDSDFHKEGSFIFFQSNVYQLHIHHRTYRHPGKSPSHTLLTNTILAIDSLLEGYYPGISHSMHRLIPCRHCFSENIPSQHPTMFSFEECSAAMQSEQPFVTCGKCKMNVAYLAPDIALADLKQVENLEIIQKIGEGGYGTVYKGKVDGQLVAVKELKARLGRAAGDDTEKGKVAHRFQEFQRECFIMSKLHHPNLVQFYGVSLFPTVRMVMEFVPCGDLMGLLQWQWEANIVSEFRMACEGMEIIVKVGERVYVADPSEVDAGEEMVMIETNQEQRGTAPLVALELIPEKRPLPDEQIPFELRLKILHDIAKGMNYLQSMIPPIIHRDLRSPNIFLVSRDSNSKVNAKVADFGLSRLVERKIGGVLGTWQWLAPEVIDNDTSEYDERSDIYSFGVVCYEVLCRKLPFLYDYNQKFLRNGFFNKWACIDAIINNQLRPVLPPALPQDLRGLIQLCWSAEPSSRPSFEIILSRLGKIMAERGMSIVEEEEEQKTASQGEEDENKTRDTWNTRYSPSLQIQIPPAKQGKVKPICLHYYQGLVIVGCGNSMMCVWTVGGSLEKIIVLPSESPLEVRSIYAEDGIAVAMGDNGVCFFYSIREWDLLCSTGTPHQSIVRSSVIVEVKAKDGVSSLSPEEDLIADERTNYADPAREKLFCQLKPKSKNLSELNLPKSTEANETMKLIISADVDGLVSTRAVTFDKIPTTHLLGLVDTGFTIVCLNLVKLNNETTIVAGGAQGDLYQFNAAPFELLGSVERAHEGSRVTGAIGVPSTGEIWTGGNDGSLSIWKIFPSLCPSSPSPRPSQRPSSPPYLSLPHSTSPPGRLSRASPSPRQSQPRSPSPSPSRSPASFPSRSSPSPSRFFSTSASATVSAFASASASPPRSRSPSPSLSPSPSPPPSPLFCPSPSLSPLRSLSPSLSHSPPPPSSPPPLPPSLLPSFFPPSSLPCPHVSPSLTSVSPTRSPPVSPALSGFSLDGPMEAISLSTAPQKNSTPAPQLFDLPKKTPRENLKVSLSVEGDEMRGGKEKKPRNLINRLSTMTTNLLGKSAANISVVSSSSNSEGGGVVPKKARLTGRPLQKAGSGLTSWVLVTTIHSHEGRITDFCIAKNGIVCSASFDRVVRFWDPVSYVCIQELKRHEDSVTSVLCPPEDDFSLWTASLDRLLCVWTTTSYNPVEMFPKNPGAAPQPPRNLSKANESEELGVSMKEDGTLEELVGLIEKNINLLAEANKSHAMNTKKVAQLCDIILEDLRKGIGRAESDPGMMRKFEDQITVTLLEKKKLVCKVTPGPTAKKANETIEKTPLGDALAKFEVNITQFHENLRILVSHYDEELFQKQVSPALRSAIFRNSESMACLTTELKQKLKGLSKEIERRLKEKAGESDGGGNVRPQEVHFATAAEMAGILAEFFRAFIDLVETYVYQHPAAITALQLCFYRPSLALAILRKRDELGRTIEELLECPLSFMRHTPFLLGVIVEHLPVSSDPSVLFGSIQAKTRAKLWELNQARVSKETQTPLRFTFWPRPFRLEEPSRLVGNGAFLLRSTSVMEDGGEEVVITSQQRSLLVYIFETSLVLIAHTCGKVDDIQRRVCFTPSTSTLRLLDDFGLDPEMDNVLNLLFRSQSGSAWENWSIILPSNLMRGNLKQTLREAIQRNSQREQPEHCRPSPKAQDQFRYQDTFLEFTPNEQPLPDQEVHFLPLFDDIRAKQTNIFSVITDGDNTLKKSSMGRGKVPFGKSSSKTTNKSSSKVDDRITTDEAALSSYFLKKLGPQGPASHKGLSSFSFSNPASPRAEAPSNFDSPPPTFSHVSPSEQTSTSTRPSRLPTSLLGKVRKK